MRESGEQVMEGEEASSEPVTMDVDDVMHMHHHDGGESYDLSSVDMTDEAQRVAQELAAAAHQHQEQLAAQAQAAQVIQEAAEAHQRAQDEAAAQAAAAGVTEEVGEQLQQHHHDHHDAEGHAGDEQHPDDDDATIAAVEHLAAVAAAEAQAQARAEAEQQEAGESAEGGHEAAEDIAERVSGLLGWNWLSAEGGKAEIMLDRKYGE